MTLENPTEKPTLVDQLPIALKRRIEQLPPEIRKAFESGLEVVVKEKTDIFSQSDQQIIGIFISVAIKTDKIVGITISSLDTVVEKEGNPHNDFRVGQCRFMVFTTTPVRVTKSKSTTLEEFHRTMLDNDLLNQGVDVEFDLSPDIRDAFIQSGFVNNSAIPTR